MPHLDDFILNFNHYLSIKELISLERVSTTSQKALKDSKFFTPRGSKSYNDYKAYLANTIPKSLVDYVPEDAIKIASTFSNLDDGIDTIMNFVNSLPFLKIEEQETMIEFLCLCHISHFKNLLLFADVSLKRAISAVIAPRHNPFQDNTDCHLLRTQSSAPLIQQFGFEPLSNLNFAQIHCLTMIYTGGHEVSLVNSFQNGTLTLEQFRKIPLAISYRLGHFHRGIMYAVENSLIDFEVLANHSWNLSDIDSEAERLEEFFYTDTFTFQALRDGLISFREMLEANDELLYSLFMIKPYRVELLINALLSNEIESKTLMQLDATEYKQLINSLENKPSSAYTI